MMRGVERLLTVIFTGGNIGHKLLSLMGWAGGGLGKDGAGRAEPVTATTVFGREGLGSRQIQQNFREKIIKIVQVLLPVLTQQ